VRRRSRRAIASHLRVDTAAHKARKGEDDNEGNCSDRGCVGTECNDSFGAVPVWNRVKSQQSLCGAAHDQQCAYVSGHYQTNANNTQRDNYGTQGNVNPYTGAVGEAPDTDAPIRRSPGKKVLM
jgi:hypothetical protein